MPAIAALRRRRSQNSATPAPHTNRDPASLGCASFGVCHEGCFRLQPQELLSVVPPRCRIPLAREPSANGSPPPHRKSGRRRRHTARPSAARCTEDNSVLWPGACRACHAHCFHRPFPPPAGGSARASRSRILHATPLTPLLCSAWRGRSPPTPHARPLHPRGLRSEPAQLALRHRPRLRRDEIPECIGGVITADTILVAIHLQHILRPTRIVL